MCNLLALPLTGQVEVCQGLSLSFPIIEVEGLVDSTSGPWTGSISITWQLLETQILECHLDLIDKRLLGWGVDSLSQVMLILTQILQALKHIIS